MRDRQARGKDPYEDSASDMDLDMAEMDLDFEPDLDDPFDPSSDDFVGGLVGTPRHRHPHRGLPATPDPNDRYLRRKVGRGVAAAASSSPGAASPNLRRVRPPGESWESWRRREWARDVLETPELLMWYASSRDDVRLTLLSFFFGLFFSFFFLLFLFPHLANKANASLRASPALVFTLPASCAATRTTTPPPITTTRLPRARLPLPPPPLPALRGPVSTGGVDWGLSLFPCLLFTFLDSFSFLSSLSPAGGYPFYTIRLFFLSLETNGSLWEQKISHACMYPAYRPKK